MLSPVSGAEVKEIMTSDRVSRMRVGIRRKEWSDKRKSAKLNTQLTIFVFGAREER